METKTAIVLTITIVLTIFLSSAYNTSYFEKDYYKAIGLSEDSFANDITTIVIKPLPAMLC